MLYSTNTEFIKDGIDLFEGLDLILGAGFPALDFSVFWDYDYILGDGYKEKAGEIRRFVEDRGAVVNQIHAPFGGGPEHYGNVTVPTLPRILEFASGAACCNLAAEDSVSGMRDKEYIFDFIANHERVKL